MKYHTLKVTPRQKSGELLPMFDDRKELEDYKKLQAHDFLYFDRLNKQKKNLEEDEQNKSEPINTLFQTI